MTPNNLIIFLVALNKCNLVWDKINTSVWSLLQSIPPPHFFYAAEMHIGDEWINKSNCRSDREIFEQLDKLDGKKNGKISKSDLQKYISSSVQDLRDMNFTKFQPVSRYMYVIVYYSLYKHLINH